MKNSPAVNKSHQAFLILFHRQKRLIFFLSSISFLFCFFLFSILVKKKFLTQFDFNTTVRLQDHTSLRLDVLFPFFGSIASVEVISVLLIILLVARREIIKGILILFIFFASHIVELFGKVFINHPPPPFMFYKHMDASAFNFDKYYVSTGNSYPSGHSFRIMFLALIFVYTIFSVRKLPVIVKWIVFLTTSGIVILVGVSRISLGEHWTSDVLGGYLFGLSTGILSLVFL